MNKVERVSTFAYYFSAKIIVQIGSNGDRSSILLDYRKDERSCENVGGIDHYYILLHYQMVRRRRGFSLCKELDLI